MVFARDSLEFERSIQLVINRWTILLAAFALGVAITLFLWLLTPPSKASKLQPLLADIDRYVSTNRGYPTSCLSFASFSQLTQHFSVYTGGRDTNGITWDPFEVSRHNFTVMVDQSGYEIFLPAGRVKPISFSSFPVWRYDSVKRRWQKGRIHWSYLGSYWSKD